MTKKDRIAVSISVLLLPITIFWSAEKNNPVPFILFFSPVIFYWGYRFIQNDLAFLQRNPKTAKDKSIREIATDVILHSKSGHKESDEYNHF